MRIGLIGDTHGSVPALEAALAGCRAAGADIVVHCGDFLSTPFSPDAPGETIAVLRAEGVRVVLALDVTPSLLATTEDAVRAAGLERRIAVCRASIQALPLPSDSIDFVWSRDMLGAGFPIPPAVPECWRVLRPGGAMLVYKTFAGDLLEPREAARLYGSRGGTPEEERTEYAEAAFRAAGFRIEVTDVIGGEWREHELEHGGYGPRHGLQASRLLRQWNARRRRRRSDAGAGSNSHHLTGLLPGAFARVLAAKLHDVGPKR